MFDWAKNKEKSKVSPDKAAEQRKQAELMVSRLRQSNDGEKFKVEEDKSVVDKDRLRFKVTDQKGANTDVDIINNGKVEVRGEQKEIKNAIESGEKITATNQSLNGQNEVQKDLLSRIAVSSLSDEQKNKMEKEITSHNFAADTQSTEQYAQQVQTEINANEQVGKSLSKSQKSDATKVMELRGLSRSSGQRKSNVSRVPVNVSTMSQGLKQARQSVGYGS